MLRVSLTSAALSWIFSRILTSTTEFCTTKPVGVVPMSVWFERPEAVFPSGAPSALVPLVKVEVPFVESHTSCATGNVLPPLPPSRFVVSMV